MTSTPQEVAAAPPAYQDLPALVPIATAATILGIPASSLYRYADDGTIAAERIGRRVYILKTGISRWFDAQGADA